MQYAPASKAIGTLSTLNSLAIIRIAKQLQTLVGRRTSENVQAIGPRMERIGRFFKTISFIASIALHYVYDAIINK